MKTVKEVIKTTAFILLSMAAFANPSAEIQIVAQPNKAFSIKTTNEAKEKVTISVKDYEGTLLYRDVISTERLNNRTYSMKELPSGQYMVKIKSASVIYLQPISVEGENVLIENEALKTLFAPTMRTHDNKVDLNMLCLGDFDLQIDIRDQDDNSLHTIEELVNGAVERRFDTTELTRGKYTVIIRIEDGVNSHEFYREFRIAK